MHRGLYSGEKPGKKAAPPEWLPKHLRNKLSTA